MMINAKTRVTGLIGYPVEHSLSPLMHNTAFDRLGLNYCYVAMPVREEALKDAIKGLKALNFAGFNVTVPHKENVIPLLDDIDEEARFIGAVNTVKNEDGRLRGYNTDGRGFMESLREAGIEVKGKDIFIVGAGGAARAIGYYLVREASRVCIFDIDSGKAISLVNALKGVRDNVVFVDSLSRIRSSDLIINATPLGLKEEDPLPVDLRLLSKDQVIYDLIYWDTTLVREARAIGCRAVNGLGMLLWQGVLAFRIWTGITPPVEIMREVLMQGMGRKD
ncbi:MAG TPA: shikimate dehydrogenase [Nitrospirae bacterium]|nr:shikimate dehydrogenase [Nitrospirota bacterium]